jgi:biopolymer transport protein ExbD
MRFHRRRPDEPEINLIPFIDILLVVLIFLVLTTTYQKIYGLTINLPSAQSQAKLPKPIEIVVALDAQGRVTLNRQAFLGQTLGQLAAGLNAIAPAGSGAVIVVHADGQVPHQRVVDVMTAARMAGLSKLVFAVEPSRR